MLIESQQNKPIFIIAERANQLGNRLFLFAHFIAFAVENDFILVNPCFEEYAGFFKTTSIDLFCRYPSKESIVKGNIALRTYLSRFVFRLARSFSDGKLKIFTPQKKLAFVKSGYKSTLDNFNVETEISEFYLDDEDFLLSINRNQIIFCQGPLFRDFSSFSKHGSEIRSYFQPLGIYQINVNQLIKKVREQCDLVIGVHIRWGDYLTFLEGKYFFTIEEYITVMERVKNLFPNQKVGFLIASNVKQEEHNFRNYTYFFANDHIIEDMYSLAQCDYIIGPPSTYSLWASFYGKVPLYTIKCPIQNITIDDFQINNG